MDQSPQIKRHVIIENRSCKAIYKFAAELTDQPVNGVRLAADIPDKFICPFLFFVHDCCQQLLFLQPFASFRNIPGNSPGSQEKKENSSLLIFFGKTNKPFLLFMFRIREIIYRILCYYRSQV